jgi:hypothetical protein
VTVLLNEISGHVKISLTGKDKKEVPCTNDPKDRLVCSFKPEKYSNYSVKVEGESGSPQSKFSITYKTEKASCFSSSLNHPIFVSLPAKSFSCFVFAINREIDLSLTLSQTHLQLMDHQIVTEILLNDSPYSYVSTTHT